MKQRDLHKVASKLEPSGILIGNGIYHDISCAFVRAIHFEPAANSASTSYVWVSIQNLLVEDFEPNFTLGVRCKRQSGESIWNHDEILSGAIVNSSDFVRYAEVNSDNDALKFIKEARVSFRGLRVMESVFYAGIYLRDPDLARLGYAEINAQEIYDASPAWQHHLVQRTGSFWTFVQENGLEEARASLKLIATRNRERAGLPTSSCDTELR